MIANRDTLATSATNTAPSETPIPTPAASDTVTIESKEQDNLFYPVDLHSNTENEVRIWVKSTPKNPFDIYNIGLAIYCNDANLYGAIEFNSTTIPEHEKGIEQLQTAKKIFAGLAENPLCEFHENFVYENLRSNSQRLRDAITNELKIIHEKIKELKNEFLEVTSEINNKIIYAAYLFAHCQALGLPIEMRKKCFEDSKEILSELESLHKIQIEKSKAKTDSLDIRTKAYPRTKLPSSPTIQRKPLQDNESKKTPPTRLLKRQYQISFGTTFYKSAVGKENEKQKTAGTKSKINNRGA